MSARTDEAALRPAGHTVRTGARLLRSGGQAAAIAMFLVILILVFSFSSDGFFTTENATTVLSTAAFIGIVAAGQTLVIISGGFDLSVGGIAPLSAVTYVKVSNSGVGIAGALAAALLVGAAAGLLNGALVTAFRINPLITTLATLSITGGAAYSVADGQSIPLLAASAGGPSALGVGQIGNNVWIMLALTLVVFFILQFTTFGRAIYALGGNREAAWLAGGRVNMLSISVYVISGLTAALGGITLAAQLLSADGSVGSNATLTTIAAVVLGGGSLAGGRGGALGTLGGVLVLGTLANGLTLLSVSSFYQQIVTGVVLLVVVARPVGRDKVVRALRERAAARA